MRHFILLTILSFVISDVVTAQVDNDECIYATFLNDTDNFCSEVAAHTNLGAEADPVFPNTCISLTWTNGVWFSFIAKEPGIAIRVLGNGIGTNTIQFPKIVLFESCGVYKQCSPGKTISIDELLIDDLIIGKTYYFMIESSIAGAGTFQLCIDRFIPVKAPESDCKDAVILCDKTPFYVNSLTGSGQNNSEIELGNCINEEFQSSWYKWTCDQSGTLTFTLTPNNNEEAITDDLDFALYELPNGLDDCSNKMLVRCEAAGANVTNGAIDPVSTWAKCNGPTGLREGETDVSEQGGCNSGQNNFVKPLDMVSGKSYVLIINNFSRSGLGFSIDFGGTGTFLGPKVDFEAISVDAFECDKTINFINKSESLTDPIVNYSWSFGQGADQEVSSEFGPHSIIYSSFGDKTAALTVESSKGCTVTKIVDFFINPCCKDTSTLEASAQVIDILCNGNDDGRIIGTGISGAPEYSFSLDSLKFQLNPRFSNLSAGLYTLYIRDTKGCVAQIPVQIVQPEPLIVDAGPDQTIDLAEDFYMDGSYSPLNISNGILWTPPLGLIDSTALDTKGVAIRTTSYILTVTDENGCTDTDIMELRVNTIRNIMAPNIISADEDGLNDFFNIAGNKAVSQIDRLEVYDRWGNKVYIGFNLEKNNMSIGWDGTFNGRPVVPGVYVWLASVRFVDDYVGTYSGDVTVIR